MQSRKPEGPSDEDTVFIHTMTLSEEERRQRHLWMPWNGGYRWFESPNVADLWAHYSAAQRMEIRQRLLRRAGVWQ
jgi:hypothetical protein